MLLLLLSEQSKKECLSDWSMGVEQPQMAKTAAPRIGRPLHALIVVSFLTVVAPQGVFFVDFYQRDMPAAEAHVLVSKID